MNRVIKFRGKRLESGNPTDEWVYGSLQCYYGGIDSDSLFKRDPDPEMYSVGIRACEIFDPKTYNTYAVNPETVGQFTGLRDKNGVEIYEGDIVNACSQGKRRRCEVAWSEKTVSFFLRHSAGPWYLSGAWNNESCEVIGNKFDNPELMKGGKP